jgi:hypothetical protein
MINNVGDLQKCICQPVLTVFNDGVLTQAKYKTIYTSQQLESWYADSGLFACTTINYYSA